MSAIDHAARLAQHAAAIEKLESGQALIFSKLDAIASAVHELRGAAGPGLRDILTIITQGAMLFAAIAGGIIYLSRGGSTETLHDLDKRIVRLELLAEPKRIRPMPGLFIPGVQEPLQSQ